MKLTNKNTFFNILNIKECKGNLFYKLKIQYIYDILNIYIFRYYKFYLTKFSVIFFTCIHFSLLVTIKQNFLKIIVTQNHLN